MWTTDDRRFLRSMRIASDGEGPPALPPLPRFVVVPTAVNGWYRINDRVRRRPFLDFGPENFPDPRAAAEDEAQRLNERQAASRGEDDGA